MEFVVEFDDLINNKMAMYDARRCMDDYQAVK